jgi:outer membrane lipoprotein-sorting protein
MLRIVLTCMLALPFGLTAASAQSLSTCTLSTTETISLPSTEIIAAPTTATFTTPTLPAVRETLSRITARHADIKTLIIEFQQTKIWEAFGDEIKSEGRLYLQKPRSMRCEYFQPDPSVILFGNNKFMQYTPKLKQVDSFTYESDEEAQARFRLLMLGFGLSGDEILKSYYVKEYPQKATKQETSPITLDFIPTNPYIRKVTRLVRVWFDPESLFPRKIRIEEISGDVILIDIKGRNLNVDIEPERFKAQWPKGTTVLEH